jgi:hypothetical protein
MTTDKLYRSVDEILATKWNPLMVETHLPRITYMEYVPPICRMVMEKKNHLSITRYLYIAELQDMKIRPSAYRCMKVARMIMEL